MFETKQAIVDFALQVINEKKILFFSNANFSLDGLSKSIFIRI
jgi:hypothetical protein